MITAEDGRRVE